MENRDDKRHSCFVFVNSYYSGKVIRQMNKEREEMYGTITLIVIEKKGI